MKDFTIKMGSPQFNFSLFDKEQTYHSTYQFHYFFFQAEQQVPVSQLPIVHLILLTSARNMTNVHIQHKHVQIYVNNSKKSIFQKYPTFNEYIILNFQFNICVSRVLFMYTTYHLYIPVPTDHHLDLSSMLIILSQSVQPFFLKWIRNKFENIQLIYFKNMH